MEIDDTGNCCPKAADAVLDRSDALLNSTGIPNHAGIDNQCGHGFPRWPHEVDLVGPADYSRKKASNRGDPRQTACWQY